MDTNIITTAISLFTILVFLGISVWLLIFNPFHNYSLSLIVLGILIAYPVASIMYVKDLINKTSLLVSYSILAFIAFIVTMVSWNPFNLVSEHSSNFYTIMAILACIGGLFGFSTTGKIQDKTALLSSGALIILYILFTFLYSNPSNIVSSNTGIIIAILSIVGILVSLLLFNMFDIISFKYADISKILKYSLIIIGIISVLLFFSYMTIYSIENINTGTNFFLIFINLLIMAIFVTFIVKLFDLDKKLKSTPGGDPSWMGLLTKLFLFIPCGILNLFAYLKDQYNITSTIMMQLLGLEFLLIALRIILPKLYKYLMNGKGYTLISEPNYINKEIFLANFEDINYYKSENANKDATKGDMPNYHYAISCWIYLDSLPPNTNKSYTRDTSILNIGNKPNIQFNVHTNELIIRMKEQSNSERIVLRKKDLLKYQKWNQIVINYSGGTLDVFLNNELISTEGGVIPYKQYDIVSYGTDNGLHGGICNVKYFNNSLSRSDINWMYNTMKNKSIPVI